MLCLNITEAHMWHEAERSGFAAGRAAAPEELPPLPAAPGTDYAIRALLEPHEDRPRRGQVLCVLQRAAP